MLSFAADFPLKGAKPDDVVSVVSTWITGSPHNRLDENDVEKLCAGDVGFIKSETQSLEVIKLVDGSANAIGAKQTSIDQDLIYATSIVSREVEGETWVSVRTDRASLNPQINLREARKPQIIKLLLRDLGGGLDGELWVKDTPHHLSFDDQNMAIRLINGDSENRIPIVYLSRSFRDEVTCDADALARHLGGLAHVVVEPSRDFSRSIQNFTNSRNAYGGAIGIYLPTGQRSLIMADDKDEWALRRSASEVVRSALLTSLPLPGFSWSDLEAERSREKIESLRNSGSTDLEAYIREFDVENKALRGQISDQLSEIDKLRYQIQQLNSTASKGMKSISVSLSVQDYFSGESEQFLRDALESQINGVCDGSRRQSVLKEFYALTSESAEFDRRRKLLKETLSTSNDLDNKTQRILEDLGFSITSDGKHHKLVYNGDPRLVFTMAKSSSDHRAGKNLATDITRKIF